MTGAAPRPRDWHTPSPHPDQHRCPACLYHPLTTVQDWHLQHYQHCYNCGWDNRPSYTEWIERLRAEYANYPEKYEDWEHQIIQEILAIRNIRLIGNKKRGQGEEQNR